MVAPNQPDKMSADLYRTIVLTVLAGIAVLIVTLSNRDVYGKNEVDMRDQHVRELLDERQKVTDRRLATLSADVRWLVLEFGGTPSVEPDEDHYPPQPDAGQ